MCVDLPWWLKQGHHFGAPQFGTAPLTGNRCAYGGYSGALGTAMSLILALISRPPRFKDCSICRFVRAYRGGRERNGQLRLVPPRKITGPARHSAFTAFSEHN